MFKLFPKEPETKKSIFGMIFSDHEDENESHEHYANVHMSLNLTAVWRRFWMILLQINNMYICSSKIKCTYVRLRDNPILTHIISSEYEFNLSDASIQSIIL